MSRVYAATTLSGLAELHRSGTLPAGAERVVAVDSDEESEYDALMTAADLSAGLGGPEERRVVVVAELAGPDDGAEAPIPLADVVAVHCDPAGTHDPDDELAWYATQEIEALLADH